MGNIFTSAFRQACREFPNVNQDILKAVLIELNSVYAAAKQRDVKIDFIAVRNRLLREHGIDDLFEFQEFKQAIGKYYALRKARTREDGELVGTVLEADTEEVLIVASKQVNLLFRSNKAVGKLEFSEVFAAERFAAPGVSLEVLPKEFHDAKVKALAILNGHRGF